VNVMWLSSSCIAAIFAHRAMSAAVVSGVRESTEMTSWVAIAWVTQARQL